jgi:S-adenosylmethionine:tRNA ribosyltransferase-isomerase
LLRTSDFDFDLPPERIAQHPPARREEARLMVLDRRSGATAIGLFPDLLAHLRPGDVLVLNETRVIPARLFAERPGTGGRVELLLVRPGEEADTWWALARPGRALQPGRTLVVRARAGDGASPPLGRLTVRAADGGQYALALDGDWAALLAAAGHVPLPPYIRRPDTVEDRERYQTVFARVPGAVAAPTAGLHFTPELLAAVEARGVATARVVLHVGPGTFKPVTVEEPRAHALDAEWYAIPAGAAAALAAARAGGGRVIAVGTTVARTLETGAARLGEAERAAGAVVAAGQGWTDRLIVPPYEFLAVDALVTNFHLPRSSLLFLVAALAGREAVLAAYRRAVEEGFRFYSYGDAMFVA